MGVLKRKKNIRMGKLLTNNFSLYQVVDLKLQKLIEDQNINFTSKQNKSQHRYEKLIFMEAK